jgi:hypothetical protein
MAGVWTKARIVEISMEATNAVRLMILPAVSRVVLHQQSAALRPSVLPSRPQLLPIAASAYTAQDPRTDKAVLNKEPTSCLARSRIIAIIVNRR